MIVAGILGSFEQDILFVVIALLLFGRRLPEVASSLGKKMHQFRRGLDDMKSEITKPIRDSIEAPIRDVTNSARTALRDAGADVRRTAEEASSEIRHLAAASAVSSTDHLQIKNAPESTPSESQQKPESVRAPFPYPGAQEMIQKSDVTKNPDATPFS
ncbi:MAG: twin-arginine translocase TatA/TatE family subunit [Planctomycetota bacterium]